MTVFPDGRVSFDFVGTLNLTFSVLVSTAHSGKLTIVGDSLRLKDYNASDKRINFSYSGISADSQNITFEAGEADIVPLVVPFWINFSFSESHILEHETKHIANLEFRIEFYDFQTKTRVDRWKETFFMWNNQTSLP